MLVTRVLDVQRALACLAPPYGCDVHTAAMRCDAMRCDAMCVVVTCVVRPVCSSLLRIMASLLRVTCVVAFYFITSIALVLLNKVC